MSCTAAMVPKRTRTVVRENLTFDTNDPYFRVGATSPAGVAAAPMDGFIRAKTIIDLFRQ